MAVTSRSIKCTTCNVFTENADYCKKCGQLLSYAKKEAIRATVIQEEMVQEEKFKLDNPNWVERLKKHPIALYRFVGVLLHSVIFVVSAVGSLLAWSIAMIAAG